MYLIKIPLVLKIICQEIKRSRLLIDKYSVEVLNNGDNWDLIPFSRERRDENRVTRRERGAEDDKDQ